MGLCVPSIPAAEEHREKALSGGGEKGCVGMAWGGSESGADPPDPGAPNNSSTRTII